MKLYRAKNYEELSKIAANIMAAQITLKPDSVIGLATGSTPIGMYDNLVAKNQAGDLDFSQVTTVNLDEYKGLPASHDQSYSYFMHSHLFDRINLPQDRCFLPDGTVEDAEVECARYEALIDSLGGVDMQLLGIGHNGHIGFNEPAEAFALTTNCVTLTQRTLEANKRFFSSIDEVPKQAFTMGIGTIMKAKKILMVITGADKAEALYAAFCGPITPAMPASILQLHPDVTLVADEAALSKYDA